MQEQQYQSAAKLFDAALELPPEGRDAFLNQAAADDSVLLARVQRMVRYAEQSDTTSAFLPGATDARRHSESAASIVGTTISNYRITDVIGEGGFGVVYAAEQQQPVRRNVALKILKGGMDSQQVLARFEAERHVLAMLDHPGIARIYDAGTTGPELGCRPYFVMERVQGLPITDYCNEHQLSCEQRLQLLIMVCNAVQYAHHKGIIHRDLKPSNILVTEVDGVPVPKIIDFGIAKAIHQPLLASNARELTARMEILGTPQYMSPEQANSDLLAIDTRSDVYSLGVVLYELITGTTPLRMHDLRTASYTQLIQMILNQTVQKPSTRIRICQRTDSSSHASSHDQQVHELASARFRRELDWIALKALDGERERRYASPQALADDLRRYLNHEPLHAGPPSALYRCAKFIRRHRLGVSAAALIVIAVLSGSILATLGMIQARISADEAQQVNQFMHDVLTSADPNARGAEVRLVEVLTQASKDVSQRFEHHPRVHARVRSMLGEVFLKLDLGQLAAAEFAQSVQLYEQMHGAHHLRTLQERLMHVRALCSQNLARDAERALNEATPLIESLTPSNDRLSLEAQRLQGVVHKLRGRSKDAEIVLRSLHARFPTMDVTNADRVMVLESLLSVLLSISSSAPEARRPQLRQELEQVAREILDRSGDDALPSISVLWAQTILAQMLWDEGEAADAARLAGAVVEQTRSRLGDCHIVHMRALGILAWSSDLLGDSKLAADLVFERLNCTRKRSAQGDPVALLSDLHDSLPYFDRGGRWAEGEVLAREYTQLASKFGNGHHNMGFYGTLYVARFISLQNRFDEAQPLFDELFTNQEVEFDTSITRSILNMFYGSHLRRQNRLADAESHLQIAANRLAEANEGIAQAYRAAAINELIALYEDWNKPDKVAEVRLMQNNLLSRAN